MVDITTTEAELIDTLTSRVRILSSEQLAETWFASHRRSAPRVLSRLHARRWLEQRTVLCRPQLALNAPVCCWQAGEPMPDLGAVAYQLQRRWTQAVVPTTIFRATPRARALFGGHQGGRWPRTAELSHDVNLAGVFLWYREHRPLASKHWVSEVQLYAEGGGKGARLPDAVIRPGGAVERVVEFGGAYGKQKLVALHHELAEKYPAYEIW